MKKCLSAGALLLCCGAAQAAPTEIISWGFSFTGFHDSVSNSFLPREVITGAFRGHDLDGDGLLEKDELLSLVVGELDYIACAATSSPYSTCGATGFSFSQDAGLHFSVGSYGQDPEGWVGGGRLITTGDQHYAYAFDPQSSSERHLYWTSETRLSMMSQAPEPHGWALLAAGLLGLGWRARRAPTQAR